MSRRKSMSYYTPLDFNQYKPTSFEPLTPDETYKLKAWIEQIESSISDEHLIVLLFYFALDMDKRSVMRITKLQYAAGIAELFRFRCKQQLRRKKEIANKDMRRVLRNVIADSEIILLREGRGVCLFTGKVFPEAMIINAVIDSKNSAHDK